jgi:hypothetical protein
MKTIADLIKGLALLPIWILVMLILGLDAMCDAAGSIFRRD